MKTKTRPKSMTLIGTGEIERLHGVTRVQVFRLLASGDWPKPFAQLEDGRKVWQPSVIKTHVLKLRKEGRITPDGRVVPRRFLTT